MGDLHQESPAGVYLGDLTWEEAAAALPQKIVVLPFAAGAKAHGPHLPLASDRIVMDHLLEAAVRHRDVLVAPPILHGWFPAFRGYAGTEVADAAVFQGYVGAVARSLIRHGAKRLVLLNLGIGTATGLPLATVARDLVAELGVTTLVVSWEDLETADAADVLEQSRGGHADEAETSILLYLRPDLVLMERAVTDYRARARPRIGFMPGLFDRATEPGVFGDPTLATADKGERLLAIMVGNWLAAIDQLEAP